MRTPAPIALFAVAALAGCLPATGEPPGLVPPGGSAPEPAALSLLDWEVGRPERATWSAALREALAADLGRVGVPADAARFCPAFPDLDAAGRVEALAVLAVAVARRESAYDPATVFAEPPPLGVDSVGLFQLSYEDGFAWCDLDRERSSLTDPETNVRCAAGTMARLIERDGVIAAGRTGGDARGLARYWSVIREGDDHFRGEIEDRVRALPLCGDGG